MADLPENLNRAAPVPVNVPRRTAVRRADIVQQRRDDDAIFRQFAPVPQGIVARFQRMARQPARISVMPVASHREKVATPEVGDSFGHSFATGGLEASEELGFDFRVVHGYRYVGRGNFFQKSISNCIIIAKFEIEIVDFLLKFRLIFKNYL